MPEEQKILYQQLKYWAIDNVPASIKESVLRMLEEKDEPRAYSNDWISPKEMSVGQTMIVAALIARTFFDKKAA